MNDENLSNENTAESYIKIPTIIQDAFCRIRIPGESRQILDGIIRKTLGWRKVKDKISISQLCKITGVKRPNVIRSIKCLEDMKIIVSDRTNYITVHQVNLNVEEWQDRPKHQTGIRNDTTFKLVSETIPEVVSETILGSIRNDTKTGIRNDTHKRKKDTLTKDTLTKRPPLPSVSRMRAIPNKTAKEEREPSFFDFLKTATDFCEEAVRVDPKCKPESIELAAKIFAGIGESPAEISTAIEWAFADEFWKANMESAKQFARNYGKIKKRMDRVKKSKVSNEFVSIQNMQPLSMFAPSPDNIPDSLFCWIIDAIKECKTIETLKTKWEENPAYEKYNVLKSEKNHRLHQLASQKIENAKTEAELNNAFTEDEMHFTAHVANIASLFCEKMEELTGAPMDSSGF